MDLHEDRTPTLQSSGDTLNTQIRCPSVSCSYHSSPCRLSTSYLLFTLDSNVIYKVIPLDPTPQPLVVFIPQGLSQVWKFESKSDARVFWNTLNLRVQGALTESSSKYLFGNMDKDKRHHDESAGKKPYKLSRGLSLCHPPVNVFPAILQSSS